MNALLGRRLPPVDDLGDRLARLAVAAVQTRHAAASKASRWQLPIMNLGIVDGSLTRAPESYKRTYEFLADNEPVTQP